MCPSSPCHCPVDVTIVSISASGAENVVRSSAWLEFPMASRAVNPYVSSAPRFQNTTRLCVSRTITASCARSSSAACSWIFSAARLRSVISVHVPIHSRTAPSLSSTGTPRTETWRYSPSCRRMRYSVSYRVRFFTAAFQTLAVAGRSSGCKELIHPQPCNCSTVIPVNARHMGISPATCPSGFVNHTICAVATASDRYRSSLTCTWRSASSRSVMSRPISRISGEPSLSVNGKSKIS